MIKNVVKRGWLDDQDLRDASNYVIRAEVEPFSQEEEGGPPRSVEFSLELNDGYRPPFETYFYLCCYDTEENRVAKTKEYVAFLHNLINAAEDYLDTVISMVDQFEGLQ